MKKLEQAGGSAPAAGGGAAASGDGTDVETAIENDSRLNDGQRKTILMYYRRFIKKE